MHLHVDNSMSGFKSLTQPPRLSYIAEKILFLKQLTSRSAGANTFRNLHLYSSQNKASNSLSKLIRNVSNSLTFFLFTICLCISDLIFPNFRRQLIITVLYFAPLLRDFSLSRNLLSVLISIHPPHVSC